jgi:hypothetical protein
VPDSDLSGDAFDRRGRTHSRLEAEGIFYHPGLMLLPGANEVRLPGPDDIALRALALLMVACEGTGLGEHIVDSLIDEYRPPFSPAEWRWFESPARGPEETRNFGWRFEAALPLLWAVGLAETMRRADAQTEPSRSSSRSSISSATSCSPGPRCGRRARYSTRPISIFAIGAPTGSRSTPASRPPAASTPASSSSVTAPSPG